MVEAHYYLKGLEIDSINGKPKLKVHGTDYYGKEFYGEFNKESFKGSMLKVDVRSFVCNSDWAWVNPIGGVFHDRVGIPVKKADLQKIIDSQLIFQACDGSQSLLFSL